MGFSAASEGVLYSYHKIFVGYDTMTSKALHKTQDPEVVSRSFANSQEPANIPGP